MPLIEDSFAALVRLFLASPQFADYAPSTREVWERYLRLAIKPERGLGNVSLQAIRPSLVQSYLDGMAGKPGKQAATLCAVKQVERWASVRDYVKPGFTIGCQTEESDGGHIPWSDAEVAIAQKHARHDLARVVTLGANTGQRGSDLIRMGWSDVEVYKGVRGINVRQKKTARVLWIPIMPALAAYLDTWEKRTGPFLRKLDDQPWTREQLTAAWTREREANPELKALRDAGLVLHGLRGHACVRLLRSGFNTRQISDWVGMSEPMVKNYTRFSDQKDNALAAVHLLDGTLVEQPFNKLRKNAF
jgi:integrase